MRRTLLAAAALGVAVTALAGCAPRERLGQNPPDGAGQESPPAATIDAQPPTPAVTVDAQPAPQPAATVDAQRVRQVEDAVRAAEQALRDVDRQLATDP